MYRQRILLNPLILVSSVIVISSDESGNFSDTCDYNHKYPCGDICIEVSILWPSPRICLCGDEVIINGDYIGHLNLKYCCSLLHCKRTVYGAHCLDGEVLEADHFYVAAPDFVVDDSPLCHGKCYNDYLTSQYTTMFSHYTCPDMCVYWSGLCRGVSFCDGDEEICGEDLRCPGNDVYATVTKHTMPTEPVRSYCFGFSSDADLIAIGFDHTFGGMARNDLRYDNIDRSDEDVSQVDDFGRQKINYTALEFCTDKELNNPHHLGLKCDDHCIGILGWCLKEDTYYCNEAGVLTNDPVLCSNHTFWKNISCDLTSFYFHPSIHPSIYKGERCSGTTQHCYYPWEPSKEFYPLPDMTVYTRTCSDKSDRVFQVGQTCPDEIPKEICYDWFLTPFPCPNETPSTICWESCSNPSPNCTACTNTTFFFCSQSNQCIHPSLQCDGHPQCDFGEDEDLDGCKGKYQQNRVISKYATFRCQNIMYPIMETYATACDGFPECINSDDEELCSDDKVMLIILPAMMIVIALIYLTLKLGRFAYVWYKRRNEKVYSFKTYSVNDILKVYSENHRKIEGIDQSNILLLHTIFSKSKDEIKDVCRKLYNLESRIHNNEKNEIFCCLHNKLDPLIFKKILENQFPGIALKCMDHLKGRRIFFNFLSDKSWVKVMKSTITRLIKIEFEYLDILKDSFFAYSLYRIVGGYTAILQFPTHFSIIVVLCFSASVVIPIFFATLHLATHNPYLIFNIMPTEKIKNRFTKMMMTVLCLLFSFLNPVLLVNVYESTKEKTRKMAKHVNGNLTNQILNLQAVKNQWVAFLKIELGKLSKHMRNP